MRENASFAGSIPAHHNKKREAINMVDKEHTTGDIPDKMELETKSGREKLLREIETQTDNPLDHIELSINAKNQITGKIKIHYDGHDRRNKQTAFHEAMNIMRNIQRVNNPKKLLSPNLLDGPMHLTDEKMDTE